MSIVDVEQAGGALAVAQPVDTDATEREGDKEEHSAPVRDDEPDPKPGGLGELLGQLVPLLQVVEPLPRQSHQDQARKTDEQQREVAEPQQPGVAARQQDRGRAREQRAEDDNRTDKVQEQREALLVGPDRGKHLRHPASRSCRPRSARSPPTPRRGATNRSKSGSTPSTPRSARSAQRRPAPVPSRQASRTRRTSATTPPRQRTRARSHRSPSHPTPGTRSRRIASQIPNAIAPNNPTTVVTVPTIPTRLRLSVAPGVRAERSETTTIHDITNDPTNVAAITR